MSIDLDIIEFPNDDTQLTIIQEVGEVGKVISFTVNINGESVIVITNVGKKTLEFINVTHMQADIELPFDVTYNYSNQEIEVTSELYNIDEHNLAASTADTPSQYLIKVCRLIIGEMLLSKIHETKDVPNDINGHAYHLIMKATKATGNGMLLFKTMSEKNKNIMTLKKASKVTSAARELLVGMCERNGISQTQLEEDFMTNEFAVRGILDGKVELSLEKFLILCKVNGVEPHDVLNAVQNNLAIEGA
jgi:hypothetical protein